MPIEIIRLTNGKPETRGGLLGQCYTAGYPTLMKPSNDAVHPWDPTTTHFLAQQILGLWVCVPPLTVQLTSGKFTLFARGCSLRCSDNNGPRDPYLIRVATCKDNLDRLLLIELMEDTLPPDR